MSIRASIAAWLCRRGWHRWRTERTFLDRGAYHLHGGHPRVYGNACIRCGKRGLSVGRGHPIPWPGSRVWGEANEWEDGQ